MNILPNGAFGYSQPFYFYGEIDEPPTPKSGACIVYKDKADGILKVKDDNGEVKMFFLQAIDGIIEPLKGLYRLRIAGDPLVCFFERLDNGEWIPAGINVSAASVELASVVQIDASSTGVWVFSKNTPDWLITPISTTIGSDGVIERPKLINAQPLKDKELLIPFDSLEENATQIPIGEFDEGRWLFDFEYSTSRDTITDMLWVKAGNLITTSTIRVDIFDVTKAVWDTDKSRVPIITIRAIATAANQEIALNIVEKLTAKGPQLYYARFSSTDEWSIRGFLDLPFLHGKLPYLASQLKDITRKNITATGVKDIKTIDSSNIIAYPAPPPNTSVGYYEQEENIDTYKIDPSTGAYELRLLQELGADANYPEAAPTIKIKTSGNTSTTNFVEIVTVDRPFGTAPPDPVDPSNTTINGQATYRIEEPNRTIELSYDSVLDDYVIIEDNRTQLKLTFVDDDYDATTLDEHIACDVSGGGFTVTLPDNIFPNRKRFIFSDYLGLANAGVNKIIVQRGNLTLIGEIRKAFGAFLIEYSKDEDVWIEIARTD